MKLVKREKKNNWSNNYLIASMLRTAGLSVTHSRVTVLSIFVFDKNIRLTACDAFKVLMKRQETVSLSTLYYVLKNLAEVGVLTETSIHESAKHYSLNSDDHKS